MRQIHNLQDSANEKNLEELFVSHLRTRSMLKSVALAEEDILSKIVKLLKLFPSKDRERVIVDSIKHAANRVVVEPLLY